MLTVDDVVDHLAQRLTTHRSLRPGDIPLMSRWCAQKNIFLEGLPLDLGSRPWLVKIYDDLTTHVVVRKATQVGGSVFAILSLMHKSDCIRDWRGAGYLFPTKTDVIDFSQTRVQPLIEENPELQKLVGEIDNAGVRRIGAGFVYFRGMKSRVGMKSFPADALVFDELDEATEQAKRMALERLAASKYKFITELSNPSLPGYGIDLAFGGNAETGQVGSDEQYWHLRCRACRTWTCMELEFPTVLNQTDLRCLQPEARYRESWRRDLLRGVRVQEMGWHRACVKCGKTIEPFDGEWVAKRPTVQDIHGYSLSQLFSITIAPYEIVESYALTRHPEHFYNLKIGIGWMPSTDRLTIQHVLRWCTETGLEERSPSSCTMGIDQGDKLHVVVSRPGPLAGTRVIVHLGVHDWDDLDDLMKRYRVGRCVIDGNPNKHSAKAFALRHRGKVFLNFYIEGHKGSPAWHEDDLKVTEDRTESLDASRAPFHLDPMLAKEATNTVIVFLPRPFDEVEEFARHMAALMKKREEDDETGSVRYVYVHSSPDHYAHAWNYDCLCWMPDTMSESRPGGTLAMAPLGTGGVLVDNKITNPEHPLFATRRKLRIRSR